MLFTRYGLSNEQCRQLLAFTWESTGTNRQTNRRKEEGEKKGEKRSEQYEKRTQSGLQLQNILALINLQSQLGIPCKGAAMREYCAHWKFSIDFQILMRWYSYVTADKAHSADFVNYELVNPKSISARPKMCYDRSCKKYTFSHYSWWCETAQDPHFFNVDYDNSSPRIYWNYKLEGIICICCKKRHWLFK